jgi:hypothetical protein
MTNAATTKETDQSPLGLPPAHPGAQFVHQPPAKEKFVPNDTHVQLFKAFASMKEGTGAQALDISLRGANAALLVAFMTDELGEKKLKKMSVDDARTWATMFKAQNPRLWPCFQRGAVVLLVQALSKDATHAQKGYADWQAEVSEILKSEPPAE